MSEALVADGFDEAIIGMARQFNQTLVVYDEDKCLSILMERDGMTEEEAIEFFEFNVVGAYVGEGTPVYVRVGSKPEDVLDSLRRVVPLPATEPLLALIQQGFIILCRPGSCRTGYHRDRGRRTEERRMESLDR